MSPFRAAAFAALAFAAADGGFADEPDLIPAADGPRAVRAGPAPDDPDRDDASVFIWDRWRDCVALPRFSQNIVTHGPATDDSEKESLGFVVTGYDGGCADRAAR